MKIILAILFLFLSLNLFSQNKPNFEANDSLYREDQFYVSISYNKLINKPIGFAQNRFAPSFSFGFLRDMPINKSRTFAIATGLGYSINNYNQNLLVTENNQMLNYITFSSNVAYDKNKLILDYVDLPIEVRWRTSTPESHKFLRIYTGFKLSCLVFDRSKYVDEQGTNRIIGNSDFSKFQYGTYLSVGYNTWNGYVYYGLNPIFKSGTLDNKNIEIRTLNFGLIFYIL